MKKVTVIWWWSWVFNVLKWLKHIDDIFLTPVVTMSDDGWSTGFLRDEYWILPPGDLRRSLVALADDDKTDFLRKLFAYRFEDGFLKWQNLWNLIMFASEKITKDYGKALNELEQLFEIKNGKVYPATEEKTRLLAILENLEFVVWETNIDIPKHNSNLKIKDFFVIKEEYAKILNISEKVWKNDVSSFLLKQAMQDKPWKNKELKEVFEESDYIIFWPWDLYTSILPNLLVWDTIDLIKNSKAKKIYISNLFTKVWETNDFKLSDFLNIFSKYLKKDIFDYILVQDLEKINLSKDFLDNYKKEWKKLVEVDLEDERIIKDDLISQTDVLRHDADKLSSVLAWIINW